MFGLRRRGASSGEAERPESTGAADRASDAPVARREIVATATVVAAALLFAVGRPVVRRWASHPSPQECDALLDRYVEHLAHAANPQVAPSAVVDAQQKARERARAMPEFARCATTLTRDEADCAMRAGGADEFERCLP